MPRRRYSGQVRRRDGAHLDLPHWKPRKTLVLQVTSRYVKIRQRYVKVLQGTSRYVKLLQVILQSTASDFKVLQVILQVTSKLLPSYFQVTSIILQVTSRYFKVPQGTSNRATVLVKVHKVHELTFHQPRSPFPQCTFRLALQTMARDDRVHRVKLLLARGGLERGCTVVVAGADVRW